MVWSLGAIFKRTLCTSTWWCRNTCCPHYTTTMLMFNRHSVYLLHHHRLRTKIILISPWWLGAGFKHCLLYVTGWDSLYLISNLILKHGGEASWLTAETDWSRTCIDRNLREPKLLKVILRGTWRMLFSWTLLDHICRFLQWQRYGGLIERFNFLWVILGFLSNLSLKWKNLTKQAFIK